ncbi:hypothetical protein LL06_25355 [Hoeflea sp. BAL378]|nr:hypothetical protein LL06_25355 [Hoeflea sp. BAL378]
MHFVDPYVVDHISSATGSRIQKLIQFQVPEWLPKIFGSGWPFQLAEASVNMICVYTFNFLSVLAEERNDYKVAILIILRRVILSIGF